MSDNSLKDKAVSGATWKLIERFVTQIVQFGIGIVLARLLCPEDYGVVGMMTIFFALASTFLDSGFASALIQRKDRTELDYSTVFVFNIIISLIIYVILYLSAPYIADFYETPILKNITRVYAVTFVINGLTGVQLAKLNIDLKFKYISQITILGQLVTGITGILLAYSGFGVWALVLQGIVSSFVTAVVIWIGSGWRPSLKFSFVSFRSLFHFGGNMLGSGIINTIYNNLYTLVIGKEFSPISVGLYNRANGYASMPANIVMDMAINVNYPILSKLQDDNKRLLGAYERLLKVPFYVLYPLLVGVIVLADPIIVTMIGVKWQLCVPYLQILCIGYMFYPLNALNMNLLYVKGRSDLAFKMEFVKKPIGLFLLFVSIPLGIEWMLIGKVTYSIIVYSINCYWTSKILNYGLIKQLRILIPIFINALLMGVLVYISTSVFSSNPGKLIIGSLVGIISYLFIGYIRKDDSMFEIISIVKNKICKK